MLVMGVPKFERFFRAAAGLDVDKDDLKRYSDFIHAKVSDLLLMGQVRAKADGRDIIEPWDLPITKGLQECMHQFRALDEEIELRLILEDLAARPPLAAALSQETQDDLPIIFGGISVALARTFKIVSSELKAVHTEEWDRSFRLFRLLI